MNKKKFPDNDKKCLIQKNFSISKSNLLNYFKKCSILVSKRTSCRFSSVKQQDVSTRESNLGLVQRFSENHRNFLERKCKKKRDTDREKLLRLESEFSVYNQVTLITFRLF